jgi:K(+)-stimulated pyrophosphate-energized sodium pump
MNQMIYLVPALGILGLVVMAVKSAWVSKQDAGDKNMQELAGYIADGAMAFLKAEWKVLSIFVVIAAALLAYSGTIHEVNGIQIHSSWIISLSFIIGAVFSATAGYIGMKVATKANVRTTQAARTSLKHALKVSFTGGTVMGLGVAGLAVLGLGGLFIIFLKIFNVVEVDSDQMKTAIEVLTGFSLGAESIALFARVGGGIYTKAADVGADLVGKVEAGIPEDDVRNPATIADNVGDNVGDVAGMGADLFGSYVATILATMVLGQEINVEDNYNGMSPILLPMVICGLGIVFSIVGTWFVTIKDEKSNVQNALNMGNWSSMILTVIASYFVVDMMLPETLNLRGYEFSKLNVFLALLPNTILQWVKDLLIPSFNNLQQDMQPTLLADFLWA